MEMLEHFKIDVKGKKVTVIGRSLVVGKPLSMLLLKKHATVTICHTKTRDPEKTCKEAEILIDDVKTRIAKIGDRPQAILLGKNQQRIMDIYHGGKNECTEIEGIPIARSQEDKCFKYIGNIHDDGMDLPFK
jgi:hypothetical protein